MLYSVNEFKIGTKDLKDISEELNKFLDSIDDEGSLVRTEATLKGSFLLRLTTRKKKGKNYKKDLK